MLPKRRILLAVALVGLVLTGVAAGLAAANPGTLHIDEMRFMKTSAEGANVTIEAITYITSHGGTSRDVRIVAYLYPLGTGVAEIRESVHVGHVAGQATTEVLIPLRLPGFNATHAGSWGVDFLVFEDGLLTQQGHGTIGYHGDFDRLFEANAGSFERAG
jgi:hypothetical protein